MLIKKINLGETPTIRYTPANKAILSLRGAYSYGWGENKKTQWVKAEIWGDRAEKLKDMFNKGDAIIVYLDEVRAEAYKSRNSDEVQAVIVGNLVSFEFAGGKQRQDDGQSNQVPRQQSQPAQQQPHQDTPSGGGFSDFDDDLPFLEHERGMY